MSHTEYYRGLAAAGAALAEHAAATAETRARAVHAALAPLLDATPAASTRQCRRGCSHCCHLPVGVTFGEVMRLAHGLVATPGLAAAVAAAAAATRGLAWNALAGHACPLLLDGVCLAHAERPLACRALASSDARACAAALRGPAVVPFDREALWRGLGAGDVLAAAEPALGHRELRSALVAVLGAAPAAQAEAFRRARPVGDPAP